MSDLFLRPNVYLAGNHDDLVVLDLKADAYSALPQLRGHVRWDADGRLHAAPSAASLLRESGLTAAGPAVRPYAPERLIQASRDLMDVELGLAPAAALQIGTASALAALHFWRRPILHLLGRPRDEVARPAVDALPDDLTRTAVQVRQLLAYAPPGAACLYRSFSLRRLLRSRGYDARWVFGIRTWPFEAHCWLQFGDCVLDDAVDRLHALTPILVA